MKCNMMFFHVDLKCIVSIFACHKCHAYMPNTFMCISFGFCLKNNFHFCIVYHKLKMFVCLKEML
jgi:hypothetical protein